MPERIDESVGARRSGLPSVVVRSTPRAVIVALTLTSLLVTACGESDLVTVGGVPPVGTEHAFVLVVETVTDTDIAGAEPRAERERVELPVRHTYIGTDDRGSLVEVRFGGASAAPLEVVLDPVGRLLAVSDAQAAGLGDVADLLGPGELFTPGIGLPAAPVRPGERWEFEDEARLPGVAEPVRLRGWARLDRLEVVDGRDAARVVTRFSYDLVRQVGEITLDGTTSSEVVSTVDLETGVVLAATTTTTGRFDVVVSSPAGLRTEGTVGVTAMATLRSTPSE